MFDDTRRTALQCAILLLALCTIPRWANATLVASSRVEMCINQGSTNADDEPTLSCQKKMVVTLTLDNGQNYTEAIEAIIDSTVDENGDTQRLLYPFRIQLAKSQGYITYPINYVQTVNAGPTEKVIYGTGPFDRCQDGVDNEDATCGWATTKSGERIEDSQGYCCYCTFGQVVGIDEERSRAGLNCFLFGAFSSSAHCLRFGDLWYELFAIGTAEIVTTITVDILRANSEGTYSVERIALSPSRLIGRSDDGTVIARLVGDFAPYKQFPELSQKYLAVASSPSSHPRVQEGPKGWMFIDKNMVDLSGTTCNKIGVSYTGFRNEPNACENPPSSCLQNQLNDLYKADAAKRSAGRVGDYLVQFTGNWVMLHDDEQHNYIALEITQVQASMVVLTLVADDIRFITNRSPGVINQAYVEDFEAQSKDGKLHAQVTNTGNIKSDYTLAVEPCSEGIKPIQAQKATIAAFASHWFVFDVFSIFELKAENNCTVTLYDSIGEAIDTVVVNFTTLPTKHTKGAQGGNPSSKSGRSASRGSSAGGGGCNENCTSFFDIPCFVLKGCLSNLFRVLGVLAAVGIGLLICWKTRCCLSVLRCCCSGGSSGSSSSQQTRSNSQQAEERPRREASSRSRRIRKQESEESSEISSEEISDTEWETYYFDNLAGWIKRNCRRHLLSLHELVDIALKGIPVYFNMYNLSMEAASLFPAMTGPHFALRGFLRPAENIDEGSDQLFEFVLPKKSKYANQWARMSKMTGEYVPLNTPQPLSDELLRTPLNRREARLFISLEPHPRLVCINHRSADLVV